jgi:hypothetical protein
MAVVTTVILFSIATFVDRDNPQLKLILNLGGLAAGVGSTVLFITAFLKRRRG